MPSVHPDTRELLRGVTLRAFVVSIVLTIIASYWIENSEVTTFFCQITESVPALPAVAFLVLLVLLYPLLCKLGRWLRLDKREIIIIYIFLCITTSMPGCGIIRFMLNTIPVLFYFDTPENNFVAYQQYLPKWLVPHDREVIRQFYEGNATGAIPWRAWAVPLAMWCIMYLALWVCMMGIVVILRRQWEEKEKLVFPLLYLPLQATEGMDIKHTVSSFFTNRIMWIGFAISFVYNVTNILNAYNPGIIALGKFYDLNRLFTEYPWTALQPGAIHYRPEMIGFGYLMSTEIALSAWLLYLLLRVENFVAVLMGYEKAGFPFDQEQSQGAYLAMALLLLWVARHHLRDVFLKAFNSQAAVKDSDEPMSYRWAVLATFGGFAAIVIWAYYAGMAPWLTITYYGIIVLTAITYARLRAEVGVPLIWMYPYYQQHKMIKYTLGPEVLVNYGGWRSATIFQTLVFMSRGYFLSMIGYQTESFRLARETRINVKSMVWFMIVAMIVGYYVGHWLHLRSYYEYGAGGLRSLEGWGATLAKTEYTDLSNWQRAFPGPDTDRIAATVVGFLFASTLAGLRMIFLRFPIHPLAFCIATSYGSLMWGTMFIVWLIKSVVLKLGGMGTYRRLIPGFIGLALGHFFTAGVLYNLVALFGGEWYQRYGVWFG